eukprot:6128568-Amphidinium_carterae.4
MNKNTERTRQERTRAQVVAGLTTLGGVQNRAYIVDATSDGNQNDEKALPSRVCFQWQRDECRRGSKCRFDHPEGEKGTKPKSTGSQSRKGSKCSS